MFLKESIIAFKLDIRLLVKDVIQTLGPFEFHNSPNVPQRVNNLVRLLYTNELIRIPVYDKGGQVATSLLDLWRNNEGIVALIDMQQLLEYDVSPAMDPEVLHSRTSQSMKDGDP